MALCNAIDMLWTMLSIVEAEMRKPNSASSINPDARHGDVSALRICCVTLDISPCFQRLVARRSVPNPRLLYIISMQTDELDTLSRW